MPASKRKLSISSIESDIVEIKPSLRKIKLETSTESPRKRRKASLSPTPPLVKVEESIEYPEWPAPADAMERARAFIRDIVENKRHVLLVPDKDADGLSAGYVLHHTFLLLGLPSSHLHVHILSKGTNVHSPTEIESMELKVREKGIERVVVLDQGSRSGKIVGNLKDGGGGLLVIDHHMSVDFPTDSLVLTACNSPPISTTSLLTYLLCKPLHPLVQQRTDWAALMGVIGDLGGGIKWGTGPWPGEIGKASKMYGGKVVGEAVSQVNAPRRTAEYNVTKAWEIYIAAKEPKEIANNAWLKLCRLDVNEEIEKWGRKPPRFSADGKVALIRVESGFQVHPVIATKWAGTLRKAKTMVMVMCANTAFNPDPTMVSFSCRISSALRSLPDDERPNLIELLKGYGNSIEGFHDRVGENFARGHKEATGGIISKPDFEALLVAMGIDETPREPKKTPPRTKTGKGKVIDATQTNGIKDFFKVAPS